tara:strand:+ start:926 stop:1267 length:342 start_codon:yes stop_codon:yes gene_type:complete
MIVVSIVLAISLILNIFLVWYLRKVLEKLMFVSDNIGGLMDVVKYYKEHVEGISELEVYCGDETIEALVNYTKAMHEELEEFEQIYSLTDQEDTDQTEEEGVYDESEEEEKKV